MTAKRQVLVADDDPSLHRLISTTLGTDDFDLLQAGDGQEALEVARRQRPDLVSPDINMPGVDGFQVCAQLDVDDDFVKPFSPIRLLKTVYALLE